MTFDGLSGDRFWTVEYLTYGLVTTDIHVGSDDVTSAWHCLDYRLRIVAKGAANVTDALCNPIIADSDIRPNRLNNRAAVQKTACIFKKKAQ